MNNSNNTYSEQEGEGGVSVRHEGALCCEAVDTEPQGRQREVDCFGLLEPLTDRTRLTNLLTAY